MSWFERILSRKKSSKIAKERLMITIAADRENRLTPYMDIMKREVIELFEKYVDIEEVEIRRDKREELELLKIDIVLRNV